MTLSTTYSEIKTYYKKTPITALQITLDNFDTVKTFAYPQECTPLDKETLRGTIETLEGEMTYKLGDYIIKNVTGDTYICDGEIFKETYNEII